MATTKLYLDTRSTLSDGTHPLKIGVSYKSLRTLIPLSIRLSKKQFNGTSVVAHPKKDFYNTFIKKRVVDIEVTLLELSTSGALRNATASKLKKLILEKVSPLEQEPSVQYKFTDAAKKKILGKKSRTCEIYNNTIARVEKFCLSRKTHIDNLSLLDIDKEWLTLYELWCRENNDHTNTISIDMRNIRAIYNEVKDGVPDLLISYPFTRTGYKIKRESTPFLSLTLEQLSILYNFKCSNTDKIYIDMFFLSYYLIGINIGDMCMATKENYYGGRLYYTRNKTAKLYSILVHPEAKKLIEQYATVNGPNLINIHACARYEHFTQRMNKHLKKICKHIENNLVAEWERNGKIGDKPTFPAISTYWARYTWANVAHRLHISKDIISMALGHSFGNKTTDIYINYDLDQVDAANKQVIETTLSAIKKAPNV